MLARTSIRTRLVALLAVPAAILVVVAGLRLVDALGVVSRTADIEALTRASQAERDLLHSLQLERTRSFETVAGWAAGERVGVETEALIAARERVDGSQANVDATIGALDLATTAPQVLAAHAEAQDSLAALGPLRFNMSGGRADARSIIGSFEGPVEALLAVDVAVTEAIDEPAVTDRLRASSAISHLKDAAFRAGDVAVLTTADAIDDDVAAELLTVAVTEQRSWARVAAGLLDTAEQAELAAIVDQIPSAEDLVEGTGDGRSAADVTAANAEALRNLELRWSASAVDEAAAVRTGAVADAASLGSLALVVLALVGLVLLVLQRKVLLPLRQLTTVADTVRTTLPESVEVIAHGRQPEVVAFSDEASVELVGRTDELGDLARAIQASTEEATRVAADQAATRAGVTRTIEDVARREQALVERQLALLDHLEDREEDPDQLAQLFRLDHLATRMRRNAENLLLLSSGRLPGGQETTPVPLVDVVRTAAAEIEQYARVDVRVSLYDEVVGYAATPLSHLLAELIENATQFSPPTTRVTVTAHAVDDGVLVRVADRGLGMAEADMADARRRLAEPPLLEAAESRRLGLYVVGLLATRLGIAVDVDRGDDGEGLVVEVLVPRALFEGQAASAAAAPAVVTEDEVPGIPSLPAREVAPAREVRDRALPSPTRSPALESSGDALSALGQLLDADIATPPDLPDDVEPAPVADLPHRAGLPRREAQEATPSCSFSAASGGRTVDLDPLAISALMAGLSGDEPDTPVAGAPAAPQAPTAPAPASSAARPAVPEPAPAPPVAEQPRPTPPRSGPTRPGAGSGWSTPFPTRES
ncbi:ATP-binding protein [Euzebya sp.]|uniref:ATP-binding protein n=1 Tax=Euzebya sp. TaxID=1971409 RepID=UPI00351456AE